MQIDLPRRLNYVTLSQLLRENDFQHAVHAETCEFDWRNTVWAALPEIMTILAWSARLVHLKTGVKWLLPDPRILPNRREDLRFAAHVGSDAQRWLEEFRTQVLSGRGMYPSQRRNEFAKLRRKILCDREDVHVDAWLNAEYEALLPLDLLGYFNRYKVFENASNVGIEMVPDPRSLPKACFERSDDSACLELSPVHTLTEVDSLVGRLCDTDELARILGDYANLDVARRGALSQILVAELGKNVGEHSDASAAWLCTRLVNQKGLELQCKGDPAMESYLARNMGFLEVLVCDNGHGIIHGLDRVLEADQRESVRRRYFIENKNFREADLVDYAFDRLSSTKRNIAKLVHFCENDKNSAMLASGLYWIWNVVRSYHGLVGVRTNSFSGWYDFAGSSNVKTNEWESPRMSESPLPFFFPGSMVRLCLPLVDQSKADFNTHDLPISWDTKQDRRSKVEPMKFRVTWAGTITRRSVLRHTRGKGSTQQELPGFGEVQQVSILEELQRQHAGLKDGDVLVLDLAGTHHLWDTKRVAPLCHFFLEMNYTATSGRSTVVLWNVPRSDEKLFEEAISHAMERYREVEDFCRVALLVRDDRRAQLLCSWPKAEQILGHLLDGGEQNLNEIGGQQLLAEERSRLDRIITENAHLFQWRGNDRVRLRAWPSRLRGEVWNQGIQWLEKTIDDDVNGGGALRRHQTGYYQLPTTGRLVCDFYSFGGMISNKDSLARIGWLLSQLISGIEHLHGEPAYIVSVTHPVMALSRHVFDNYLDGRGIKYLRESTIQELERKGQDFPPGPAIFITDVVSSGTLCEQVASALPQLKWIGTAAILDAGDIDNSHISYPTILYDPNDREITYRVTRKSATGDVYALAARQVEKVAPTEDVKKPITAIDRINICPVKLPALNKGFGQPIWPYLERCQDVLHVGHYHTGALHHYIYYVSGEKLIESTHPIREIRLLDDMVDEVVNELAGFSYDPAKIVILHSPRDTSYAEEIAIAVQRSTGALYRHVLHRDMFAGQRRFSSFIDHGIPIKDATVVIIDDGSNTGETLFGLLQTATASSPMRVMAHIALSRMPLYKVDLLRRIRSITGVRKNTQIHFATRLSIPVFSPRSCPICQFRDSISDLVQHTALLRRYARDILDYTPSVATSRMSLENDDTQDFHWSMQSGITAAQLREAIELSDCQAAANAHVIDVLQMASSGVANDTKSLGALLDLGFIVCTEPSLLSAAIFIQFIEPIFQSLCSRLSEASTQNEFLTLLGLGFHLNVQLVLRHKAETNNLCCLFWRSALPCRMLDMPTLGKFFAACVAVAKNETGWERTARQNVCCALATQFDNELQKMDRQHPDITGAMGRLFAREVIAVLKGTFDMFNQDENTVHTTLYELANAAAGKFWSHASEHVRRHVSAIINEDSRTNSMFGHVHNLVVAFAELYQLQYSICHTEHSCNCEYPGASVYWDSPLTVKAVAEFGEALTTIAELVVRDDPSESSHLSEVLPTLSVAWDNLYEQLTPAFEEVFPVVVYVVDHMWNQCEEIAHLPRSAVESYDARTLGDKQRCFLPHILFERFLRVAMENLNDRAYTGWTDEQRNKEARVRLVISPQNEELGPERMQIDIFDNGPLYCGTTGNSEENHGQGRGLDDVNNLAEPFGAHVDGPVIEDGWTRVSLSVCLRLHKGTENGQ